MRTVKDKIILKGVWALPEDEICCGEVISMGKDCYSVSTGNRIYFNRAKFSHIQLENDNNQYYVISEPDILIIEDFFDKDIREGRAGRIDNN